MVNLSIQLFDTKNIAFYTRYLDDTLLIYNSQHITPETIHNYINRIHPNLHFNPTYENNNCINFLDLLIIRNQAYLEIDIYRKPKTTDITISFLSNHLIEHKTAAYSYHIKRMLSLPLKEERRQTEWETIQTIAQNNNFPITHIARLKTRIRHKAHIRTTKDGNKKWATFTFHSSKVKKLTSLFKHTNVNIAFKSTNTTQTKHRTQEPRKK